ncbi:XRE family transcriptional regulator [Aquabacterium soli]|uniref:XRE family transcriptional regulator n=1 Tax=Aquabacterium soli TaxID=2493092 RepID=A0A3R8YL88_9BURK|nr:helix-turn-helix transcriptional regulator [Aquabacterium soli]RRS02987.1 XRE family transcriptional regulator [Aquabacterium soli]
MPTARPSSAPAPVAPSPEGHGHNALGEFLRACRDRLHPRDVGLPPGARRRAPGLRREEVAVLCGISPTWYTWIEQGRTRAVSADTLGALARGLRLSAAERAYLFELAARAQPASAPATDDEHLPSLNALVEAVRTPAYVLDRHWDAVAWNRPAAQLFEDWLGGGARRTAQEPARRNLLRYVFLDAGAPALIGDWDERARRLVAEYRADTASWRDDPVGQALVEELQWASPAFKAAWRSQAVLSREGGLRGFEHPRLGHREYEQFTLRVAQHPALKLIVLTPRTG